MNERSQELKDKVFLITGGTSGVGKAIATGVAQMGGKVVIVSRTAERGQEAIRTIAEATGNDRGEFLVADLSLQSSIRNLSEEFTRKYEHLHVLANVGGAMYFERQQTPEGIDRMFAVNVLSHFLLTNLLLDVLKESRPSRVITVAGNPQFLKNHKIDLSDIQLEKNYSHMRAMSQTMFCRILFAFELAKRLEGTGVTSVAFHPGWVKSQLGRNSPWYLKVMTPLMNARAKAECPIGVYAATAKEIEKANGAFFDDKQQILPIHEKFDAEAGRRLWSLCEALTGK